MIFRAVFKLDIECAFQMLRWFPKGNDGINEQPKGQEHQDGSNDEEEDVIRVPEFAQLAHHRDQCCA